MGELFLRRSHCWLANALPWRSKATTIIRPERLAVVYSRTRRRCYSTPAAPTGALAGIKVLDMSRVLAGPYCAQLLADYGADVIKIEDTERGDDTRHIRAAGEAAAWKPGIGPMSNYFAACNRNKRSVKLNLKHEKGRKIFLNMVKDADVVIENLRRGAMEKMNLGYDVLREVNPRIIFTSISGYGPDGPFARRAGYDMITGAEAGLLHLQGERGRGPVKAGIAVTDLSTGLYAHGAVLAALQARERTGVGQKVDASLFETQIALLTHCAMAWLNLGQEGERWGAQHPQVVPYDAFKTKDLYIVCGAVNEKQFLKFCTLLGKPELASEERFKDNQSRVNNRDDLGKILNELFSTKSTDEWMALFDGTGLPYGPINTMERVFSHPQTEAREMVQEVPYEHATSGKLALLGPAVKLSENKPTIRRRPPLYGEHTAEVLQEYGISEDQLAGLKEDGVI